MTDPPAEAEAEARLIERIASGDRQALTDLYVRYRLPLFHYLLQFTSDRCLAEELLQDTLVAVWKNACSFEGRSRVQAWLFGIARRRAYKTLRQREPQLADAAELESLPASDPEPETALLSSVARDELMQAIARLALVHREALLLSYAHDLSYDEIAEVLGVPLGTVKSRLSNAKRALRTLLLSAAQEEVE